MTAAAIEFDAGPHLYRLDGKAVPSVTAVLAPLSDFSRIPAQVLEFARWRGQAAHEACHLDNLGTLDDDTLDPVLVPLVQSWRDWVRRSGAVILASEFRVASPQFGYAGTLDAVADIGGRLTLVDIKATAVLPKPVGPQTAAYARAWLETTGQQIRDRMVVRIDQSNAEKLQSRRLTDPSDWAVFQSCLNIYRWKESNK